MLVCNAATTTLCEAVDRAVSSSSSNSSRAMPGSGSNNSLNCSDAVPASRC